MSESSPTPEAPPAGLPVQRISPSRSGPFRFIAVLLTGILIALVGILYVMIENQRVMVENQGVMIENQNKSLEHQRAKELACEIDGGEISWNTRGNQVCDLSPFARNEGGRFDLDVDWIIR